MIADAALAAATLAAVAFAVWQGIKYHREQTADRSRMRARDWEPWQ